MPMTIAQSNVAPVQGQIEDYGDVDNIRKTNRNHPQSKIRNPQSAMEYLRY
jgi:hypothetical protein